MERQAQREETWPFRELRRHRCGWGRGERREQGRGGHGGLAVVGRPGTGVWVYPRACGHAGARAEMCLTAFQAPSLAGAGG